MQPQDRIAFADRQIRIGKEEWLTPPCIIRALGEFDLDPCAPVVRPWETAREHYTEFGLESFWHGRVWLNPPYGSKVGLWMARLARHNNGVALVHARTSSRWFFEWVWNAADAILFLRGRLTFFNSDGTLASGQCVAPLCLVAYGAENAKALRESGIEGHLINLRGVA